MPPIPSNIENVFLTGFMGSGKSTVGALLSEAIGWKFVDTDSMVEQMAGMPIPKLFETEGESKFRGYECGVVASVTTGTKKVVALGGGAMGDRDNRERILRSGVVVYLSAGVETLMKRVQGTDRPLLKGTQGKALQGRIEDLLASRAYIYESAHFQVQTENKTVHEVMAEVLKGLEAWKG